MVRADLGATRSLRDIRRSLEGALRCLHVRMTNKGQRRSLRTRRKATGTPPERAATINLALGIGQESKTVYMGAAPHTPPLFVIPGRF